MYVDPKVKKSMETYARASEIIPGKTQLASRRASSFASGVSPVYAKSSSGSRFVDIDGNTYLDWKNAKKKIGSIGKPIPGGKFYIYNDHL